MAWKPLNQKSRLNQKSDSGVTYDAKSAGPTSWDTRRAIDLSGSNAPLVLLLRSYCLKYSTSKFQTEKFAIEPVSEVCEEAWV